MNASVAPAQGIALDPDQLPCGYLCVAADGRLHAANRWVREYVHVHRLPFAGRHVDELLTRAGMVLYQSYLLPLLRLHGSVAEFSLELRAAHGKSLDVLVYATRREPDPQAPIDLVLVPVRERRRLEGELLRVMRAAEQAPGMLFEQVGGADGAQRMPYASSAIRHLYGLRPEQVAHDAGALHDAVHPEDRPALDAAMKAALDADQPLRHRYRVLLADGRSGWHELRAQPQRLTDGGTLWHGFVADVTEQQSMELALRAKQSAEQANRAKSEFLARMSHELRTPLNAIIGFADLLARDGEGHFSAAERSKLQVIESSGRSLLQMINEVLDIARIEAGRLDLQLASVELHPALQRVCAMLEPAAQAAGVQLQQPLLPQGLAVQADAVRLGQVLANLLSNAVKYNRPGGRVWVEVLDEGEFVAVTVCDDGPGIPDAQRDNLFQPFHRLGAEFGGTEGTGLGLVITRNLVELMGGSLAVDSVPGQGARFAARLRSGLLPAQSAGPLAGSAAAAVAAVASGGSQDAGATPSRRVVLYVEDNPVNVMLMQALFEMRPGLRLVVAPDGAQALAQAARERPDLMLLDIHLPDMTGLELLRRLRENHALDAVPAVAVSAAALPDDRRVAGDAGFAAYWTKPLDIDRTLARLDALLG